MYVLVLKLYSPLRGARFYTRGKINESRSQKGILGPMEKPLLLCLVWRKLQKMVKIINLYHTTSIRRKDKRLWRRIVTNLNAIKKLGISTVARVSRLFSSAKSKKFWPFKLGNNKNDEFFWLTSHFLR